MLEQVKSNSNTSIELDLKISINKAFDFNKFSVDTESLAYNGEQIKPAVTSSAYKQGTDFEVVYGENKNAGEGTVTIKGINDYKGEKTYTFTIAPKEVSLAWSGDSFTYNGQPQAPTAEAENLVEGDTVNVTVEGAQTNVGTYTATATGLDNANYKLPAEATHSFTINQKELTLTWDSEATFTYDGEPHVPNAKISGVIGTDAVKLSIDGAETNASNEAYTATAKIDNANYKLPDNPTQSFTINQREVTLSWSEDILTYNKQEQAPKAEAGNIVEGDTVNVTVEGAKIDAGTYTATATALDNENYKLPAEATHSFIINQKELTLTWGTETTFTYNREPHAPSAKIDGYFEGDTVKLTVGGAQTNASDAPYTATATIDNANYKLPADNTKEFTISRAEITVSGIKANDKTYNGKTDVVFNYESVEFKGKIGDDNLSVTAEGAFEYADAGKDKTVLITKITLGGSSVGNYKLASTGQQTITTATIEQAELDYAKIQIATEGATYTGKQIKPAVTSDTYKEDVDFEVTYGKNINAGENTGSVTVTGIDNYKGNETFDFDIAKANPEYNIPTGLTAEVGQTLSDVVLPKQIAPVKGSFVWMDSSLSVGEAGTHTFLAKFVPEDIDNYNTPENIEIPVTVTATKTAFAVLFRDNTLGFYNRVDVAVEGKEFDGKTAERVYKDIEQDYEAEWVGEPIYEATVVDYGIKPTSTANWFNLFDSGSFTKADLSKLDTSNVIDMSDMFKACPYLTSVGDLSNWNTSNVTNMSLMFADCKSLSEAGDISQWNTANVTNMTSMFIRCAKLKENCTGWEITKVGNNHDDFDTNAPGIQSPWDSRLDFNEFNVDTEAKMYTAGQITPSVTSTIYTLNTDYEVVYGENKNAGENVGTITIKGLNKYQDEKTYTFTINQKELTLTWGEQTTFTYDGTAHIPSASIDGIIEGDTVNLTVKGEQTNAGVYNAVAKIDNANYKLPSVDEKEFTIARAGITVSGITAKDKDYDGTTKAELNFDQVELTGKVSTDDLTVTADGAFENVNAGEGKTVTISNLVLGGTSVNNYKLAETGQQTATTATINAVSLDFGKFSVNTDAQTYAAKQITPTVSSDTYRQGADYEVTYGENINAGENVGTITIKGTGNYKGAKTYTFTISQKELTLTWGDQTAFTYDGKSHVPSATITGAIKGDTVKLSVEGAQSNASDKAYTATAKIDNANYKLPTDNTKEFTISRAEITVSGITAKDKVYDGTTKVEFDYSKAALAGKVDDDDLTVTAEGAFEYASAGTNKEVTITKLTLGGTSAGNYKLASTGQQTSTTATINQATLDFTRIEITTEGATYTGEQIKPAVTSNDYAEYVDYEVVYGKNINAGEGSVTVKGIGNYTGEDTTTFTIAKANPNPTIPEGLTAETGQTLADVVLPKQTEPVPGTFAWEAEDPSAVPVGEAGKTPTFNAIFTPNDTNNYNTQVVAIPIAVTNTKTAFAVLFGDNTLGFYNRVDVPKENEGFDDKTVSVVYKNIENANYQPEWLDKAITSATVVDAGIKPASTANWFALTEASKLTTVDVSKLETINTTDMSSMFKGCSALTAVGDISSWNTAQVTNMASMFEGCGALEQAGDISQWNTANVTNMTSMFKDCAKLKEDCSGWKVDKVGINHKDFDTGAPGIQAPWDEDLDFSKFTVDTSAKTYAFKQITPTVTSTDYTKGTDYEVVYGANKNAGENAGTITIKGLNKHGGEQTYTFTIKQKALMINWGSEATFAYDGNPHAPNANFEGAIEGDEVNLTIKGEQTNAGIYIAVAKIDNANYALVLDYKKIFVITKAKVVVSGIVAKSKTYDGTTDVELNFDNVELKGKVDTDDLSVTAEGAFENVRAEEGKNVYFSSINITGKSVDNYELAEQGQQTSATADIYQLVAEVGWGNTRLTYNANSQLPQAYVKNTVSGDTVKVTVATKDGSDAIKIGTYEAVPTDLSNSNYSLPEDVQTQQFTIKKASIYVKDPIRAYTKEYDGTTDARIDLSQAEITGVIGSEDARVGAKGTFEDANAGKDKKVFITYSISGQNANNYEVDILSSAMSTTGTITRAPIERDKISISSEGATYTGKQVTPQVIIEGLTQNTDFTVAYGENINAGENAGNVMVNGINNYTGQKVKTFDIVKADPSYTLPQSFSAEEGDVIGDIALPTQASGTLTWNNPSRSVGNVGEHVFTATLTPNDTSNYKTITVDITVTVSQATPAFAVYSNTDHSLSFYKRSEVPTEGSTFENKEVTAVYENIETESYTTRLAPWSSQYITNATVVDEGIHPVSTARWFLSSYYSSLESAPLQKAELSKLDTSRVTDMTSMFENCDSLTSVGDISQWNTKKATSMAGMFENCAVLASAGDISQWDTSNVANMTAMFENCKKLDADCSYWNVKNVGDKHDGFKSNAPEVLSPWDPKTAFAVYFDSDGSLNFYKRVKAPEKGDTFDGKTVTAVYSDIETSTYSYDEKVPWNRYHYDIESVKVVDEGIAPVSTAFWFSHCEYLTSVDLSKLDTSNVTLMTGMFENCFKLTSLDVSNFNTSNVTNMIGVFIACSKLESIQGLQNWDTSNVTDMREMFRYCTQLKYISVSGFNMTNAPAVEGMFDECSSLPRLDLSNWDVSSIKSLYCIFRNCESLISIGDVSGWNTGNITNMSSTFLNCSNLRADCSDWFVSNLSSDMHSSFNENAPYVISPWDNPVFAVYSADDSSLCFYKAKVPEPGSNFRGKTVTAVYTDIEEHASYREDLVPWAKIRGSISRIEAVDYGISPISTANWFNGCGNVTSVNLIRFDTSRLTDTSSMFANCSNLDSVDLSSWGNSKVTDMNRMFCNCSKLKSVNLSNFDTSQVTDMSYMFNECEALGQPSVSGFNTSKVKNMRSMFSNCKSLSNLDLSKWDTSQVTDMAEMFTACTGLLNVSLGNFKTSRVTDMSYMFYDCRCLGKVAIEGWDVSSVVNMNRMLYSYYSELDLSGWNVSNVKYHESFTIYSMKGTIIEPNWPS